MQEFKSLFRHRSLYVFPDGARMIALWCELNNRLRWWFVEARDDGRLGNLTAVVQPTGRVWNYRLEPHSHNAEVCVPYLSDMMIEYIRPADEAVPIAERVIHLGRWIMVLWCGLFVSDIWCILWDAADSLQVV